MLISLVLLGTSSVLISWLLGVRGLHPIDQPSAVQGVPALIALAVWLVLFLSGVVLLWVARGWLWGLGGIIGAFWILPSFLKPFFRGLYSRPQLPQ